MIANIGAYVGVSLSTAQSADEHRQASLFVDVFRRSGEAAGRASGAAPLPPRSCSTCWRVFSARPRRRRRFGTTRAEKGCDWPDDRLLADAEFVHYVETQLAGAIGASSARIMVA